MLFSTDMIVRQRLAEPAPFSKLGTYRSIAFFGTANSEESLLAQLARVENLPEAYRSIAFFGTANSVESPLVGGDRVGNLPLAYPSFVFFTLPKFRVVPTLSAYSRGEASRRLQLDRFFCEPKHARTPN